MKFVAFFLGLVIFAYLAETQAQCPNAPRRPNCSSPIVRGRGGRGCQGGVRWGLDPRTRRCVRYQYQGCGGNSNRFCSLAACRQRCERSG